MAQLITEAEAKHRKIEYNDRETEREEHKIKREERKTPEGESRDMKKEIILHKN